MCESDTVWWTCWTMEIKIGLWTAYWGRGKLLQEDCNWLLGDKTLLEKEVEDFIGRRSN